LLTANLESTPQQRESDILYRIVDLDYDGIVGLLRNLAHPDIREQIVRVVQGPKAVLSEWEGSNVDFQKWTQQLLTLPIFEPTPSREALVTYIRWASQARWKYSEQLENLFCPEGQDTPWWFNYLYKLGRYYVAAKCMLHAAMKLPGIFESIQVQAIEAPEQQRFTLYNDRTPLSGVLQKLTDLDHQSLVTQLGKLWLTENPEKLFRGKCKLTLTTHAEMQLLCFYDHHPELVPRLKFMGTSKKACYLCQKFLSRHALGMTVAASHCKLYPTWMLPVCSDSAVKRKHKVLLWELSRDLEQTTARDLESRLGIRRAKSLDSTAGPSMPMTENQVLAEGLRLPVIRNYAASTHVDDDFLEDNDSLKFEATFSQPFTNH
jgi:hypothetical protein